MKDRKEILLGLREETIDRIDELLAVMKKASRQYGDRTIRGDICRTSLIRWMIEAGMQQLWSKMFTNYNYESSLPQPTGDIADRVSERRGSAPSKIAPPLLESAPLVIESPMTIIDGMENSVHHEPKERAKKRHAKRTRKKAKPSRQETDRGSGEEASPDATGSVDTASVVRTKKRS